MVRAPSTNSSSPAHCTPLYTPGGSTKPPAQPITVVPLPCTPLTVAIKLGCSTWILRNRSHISCTQSRIHSYLVFGKFPLRSLSLFSLSIIVFFLLFLFYFLLFILVFIPYPILLFCVLTFSQLARNSHTLLFSLRYCSAQDFFPDGIFFMSLHIYTIPLLLRLAENFRNFFFPFTNLQIVICKDSPSCHSCNRNLGDGNGSGLMTSIASLF